VVSKLREAEAAVNQGTVSVVEEEEESAEGADDAVVVLGCLRLLNALCQVNQCATIYPLRPVGSSIIC
jgi:hypothetical protein